jgi:hypothetical protein
MTGATATRTTGATATRMSGATATRTTNNTTTSTFGGRYIVANKATILVDADFASSGDLAAQYNVEQSAIYGVPTYDVVESFTLSDAESYYAVGGPRPDGLENDLALTIAANDGLDGNPSAVETFQLSDAEAFYAVNGGPLPASLSSDSALANRIEFLNRARQDGQDTTSVGIETYTLSEAESDFADGLGPRPDSVNSDEQAANLQNLNTSAPLDGRNGSAVENFELTDEYAYYASGLGPRPDGISDNLAARLTSRDDTLYGDQEATVVTYQLNEEQSLWAAGGSIRPEGLTDAQAQRMQQQDGVAYPKSAIESFEVNAEMAAYSYLDPDSGLRGPVPSGVGNDDQLLEQLRDLDIVEVYNVDEEYEYDSSTTRVVTPATTKSAVVTSIATRVKQ